MRIFPLGDNAITIEFGSELNDSNHSRVVSLARHFDQHPFPGFVECIPAYVSLSIVYDLVALRKAFPALPTAAAAIEELIRTAVKASVEHSGPESREITVSVDFADEVALDLNEAAADRRLSRAEFIEIFLANKYSVYMLGFLPGFAYMGEVDERISVGRKASPRQFVSKGSIGIAGRQTGIYPLDSPGGWQIIGRTDATLFDPTSDDPCLFRVGDCVRFVREKE